MSKESSSDESHHFSQVSKNTAAIEAAKNKNQILLTYAFSLFKKQNLDKNKFDIEDEADED